MHNNNDLQEHLAEGSKKLDQSLWPVVLRIETTVMDDPLQITSKDIYLLISGHCLVRLLSSYQILNKARE
jgi:hypothetical protein